jgi:hypothetical protein
MKVLLCHTTAHVAGASSSQQARHGFKGLNFTAKLKKAMVDRRGPAEGEVILACMLAYFTLMYIPCT